MGLRCSCSSSRCHCGCSVSAYGPPLPSWIIVLLHTAHHRHLGLQCFCTWPAATILYHSASAHAPPRGGVSIKVSHQELWSRARPLHAVSSDGRCTQSHLRWDLSGVRAEWPDGERFLKMYHSSPFCKKLHVIGS